MEVKEGLQALFLCSAFQSPVHVFGFWLIGGFMPLISVIVALVLQSATVMLQVATKSLEA